MSQAWSRVNCTTVIRRRRNPERSIAVMTLPAIPRCSASGFMMMFVVEEGPSFMKQPAFTVVVANRNHSRYLPIALESVRRQTDQSFECIVVDDASEDNSCALVESFPMDLTLIRKSASEGAAAAHNTAIEIAKSGLVAFLDADDAWHSSKLETARRVFNQRSQVGLYYHRLRSVPSAGRADIGTVPISVLKGNIERRVRMAGGYWHFSPTSGLVLRRELLNTLGAAPPDLFRNNPDSFWAGAAPYFTEVWGDRRILGMYRLHEENTWNTKARIEHPETVADSQMTHYEIRNDYVNRLLDRFGAPPVALDRNLRYKLASIRAKRSPVDAATLLYAAMSPVDSFSERLHLLRALLTAARRSRGRN